MLSRKREEESLDFVESYAENSMEFIKVYSKTKKSYFTVAPERGAIVVLLNLSGKDILYLNKETLFDKTKNIRGGIPILFPICGRVVDGKITFKGQEYPMKNHGFARDTAWEVVGYIDELSLNGVVLKLSSSGFTKTFYPYDFELFIKYTINDEIFGVEMIVKNNDREELPFYAGFHPYFLCNKDEFTLKLDCEKCFDDVEKKFVDLENFKELDFSKPEINLDFFDVGSESIEFTLDKDKRLLLVKDKSFKNIVVWSLRDYDFVCIEPWMGEHEGYLQNKYYYLKPNDIFKAAFAIVLNKE